jgi:hypothetical protein
MKNLVTPDEIRLEMEQTAVNATADKLLPANPI